VVAAAGEGVEAQEGAEGEQAGGEGAQAGGEIALALVREAVGLALRDETRLRRMSDGAVRERVAGLVGCAVEGGLARQVEGLVQEFRARAARAARAPRRFEAYAEGGRSGRGRGRGGGKGMGSEDHCFICRDGGELVCCSACPKVDSRAFSVAKELRD
jgi:hypothetical protein